MLVNYMMMLADDALLMGHRLSEWTGHGPVLEQDIAISNIALDYIGQARNCFQYAALLKNDGSTEDSLAYLRDTMDFKNHLLTELPNGDWARSVLKICFFSAYQVILFRELQALSNDAQLAAIAEKSLKEATYHLRWSSEWVMRLGDGTPESRSRIERAVDELMPYTAELFVTPLYNPGYVRYDILKEAWIQKMKDVFETATLAFPGASAPVPGWIKMGGMEGRHTEHLGFILAEMQFLQRTYPGSEW